MSAFSFSPEASKGQAFDLIPNGTLTYGVIEVKAIKNSQSSSSRFIEIELHLTREPYQGRRVFARIGDPTHEGNSEKYRQMGLQALTRIFEAKGIFKIGDAASYRYFDGASIEQIAQHMEGGDVPVKIKIEKGTDGHADKNDIADWLTPNPEAGCAKLYKQLVEGPKAPVAPVSGFGAAPVTTPVAAPGFAVAAQPQAPAAGAPPAWLNKPAA